MAALKVTAPVSLLLAALALAGAARAQDGPPAPPAAPAPAPSTSDLENRLHALEQLAAEQKAALEALTQLAAANDAATAEALVERKLQIYGFIDAGMYRVFDATQRQQGLYSTPASTFVSGNTNIYIDARPTPQWRAMIETRFTLLPHGQEVITPTGQVQRTDTNIDDTTSPSGRNFERWGSIIMERAYMQWTHDDRLEVQVGYLLTPWGIWNVDHGTPTLISMLLPSFLVYETVPRHQTGVQVQGKFGRGDYEIAYRVYLSNGRTTTLVDFTDDKAVGARVLVSHFGEWRAALGGSFYWGTSSDVSKSVGYDGLGLYLSTSVPWALTEWVAGADLSVDWKGWRLRAEGVVYHVQYDAGKHPLTYERPGETYPNRYESYSYVILARRMGMFEPYFYGELVKIGFISDYLGGVAHAYSLGLNVHFTPAVQLKLQAVKGHWEPRGERENPVFANARLVLSF